MKHPVVWFEVMGTEGKKLRSFYGDLFAWTYDVDGTMEYGMVNAPKNAGISGGVGQGDAPRVTFYVETPCIEESLARAGELGGKTLMPRTELPGVILGMFADPEGNVVGLVEAQAAA
ncbi:MAG: hypothetical protein R3B40_16565 [Polyangiales bacterium]|nr:hypothetical protein [Myxococcales bacterium]MCB9659637.1 glyoxalase [Sandaracinaceae bacterium]